MVAIIGGEPHRFRPLIDRYRQAGLRAEHSPDQLKVGIHRSEVEIGYMNKSQTNAGGSPEALRLEHQWNKRFHPALVEWIALGKMLSEELLFLFMMSPFCWRGVPVLRPLILDQLVSLSLPRFETCLHGLTTPTFSCRTAIRSHLRGE